MAQNFTVNVYEINGIPKNTPQTLGFPSAQCMFQPYNGNNYNLLYGIVTTLPTGFNYATVENPTQLATKANA